MINPGALGAGAYYGAQNTIGRIKQSGGGEPPKNNNNINRPKMVTTIAIGMLLIAAYAVINTFGNWDSWIAFIYHITIIGVLTYCGFGFLGLKKNHLKYSFR